MKIYYNWESERWESPDDYIEIEKDKIAISRYVDMTPEGPAEELEKIYSSWEDFFKDGGGSFDYIKMADGKEVRISKDEYDELIKKINE